MSLRADTEALVGHMAANWSGSADPYYPGHRFEVPEPTGDFDDPAHYWVMEVLYNSSEYADFAGGELRRGDIVFSIWVEAGGHQAEIEETADAIVTIWAAASIAGYHFFTPERTLGDPVTEGPFEGRALRVPFIAGL